MKSYKIHLIRNGLTEGNLNGLYIGRTDEPLCPQGLAGLMDLKNNYGYPLADYVLDRMRRPLMRPGARENFLRMLRRAQTPQSLPQ